MDSGQGDDDVIRVNMMLLECVRIIRQIPSESVPQLMDTLLSVNALCTQLAVGVQETLAKTQTCPGPYWRQDASFQERIKEKNQNKKRKTNPKTQCTGSKKGASLSFDKGGQGPPRDGGVRRLCNLCYQTFTRDQGAGLFEK